MTESSSTLAPLNSISSALDLSLFRRLRPRLYAVILKLLPDLDKGHLVAGVSEPLVHLGELRVEAEVVNVLGVSPSQGECQLTGNNQYAAS